MEMKGHTGMKPYRARVKWIPESDWLAIRNFNEEKANERRDGATQLTVQELLAGTRDHLSQFAGSVFEIAGSESAEDRVSGIGGARIENAAGSNQRLLRFVADRFAGS